MLKFSGSVNPHRVRYKVYGWSKGVQPFRCPRSNVEPAMLLNGCAHMHYINTNGHDGFTAHWSAHQQTMIRISLPESLEQWTRSETGWFTGFCKSLCRAYFAASFINVQAKACVASRVLKLFSLPRPFLFHSFPFLFSLSFLFPSFPSLCLQFPQLPLCIPPLPPGFLHCFAPL